MKYSHDKKVVFNDDDHTYFLGDKRLTSVTQYLSKYKPVFDSDLIAGKYAKKHGLKKESVLKMWKDKGDLACEIGTFVHSIFEDYINGNMININDEYKKCYVAENIITDIFKSGRLTPIETEYIVYDDKLAGQIDCIAKDKSGKYYILDWKTNSKITFNNRWQKMLSPYDNLDDCSYNHYSMQLGIYKQLCKEYKIDSCYIVHIDETSYKFHKTNDILINI